MFKKRSLLFSLIFLFVVFVIFARQVFFGKVPFPADDIVGLYYPFIDIYSVTNPSGIPYKNSLITDSMRQQYPWRNLVIDAEKKLQLPLWNPYNFTGEPLLANFQSAPFYPLNILYFVFPFLFVWTVQVLAQTVLLGLFTFFYLRFLKIHTLSQILGAITISFCGFVTAWYEWNTVIQTFLWLPLLLLSIENIQMSEKRKRLVWCAVFIFALSASLFAGHTQTFFYILLFTLSYIVFLLPRYKKKKEYMLTLSICFLIFAVITAIQWLPFLQFVQLSARSYNQLNWQASGWFIPWQQLIMFIAPDFFGNPATVNYWGTWNYGEFIGYIGIVPLFFVFYAIQLLKNKYVCFFIAWAIVALLFALPDWIGFIPYKFSIPLISTSQPTRLLSVIDFSLTMLAAFGFESFLLKRDKKLWLPIGVIIFCMAVSWSYLLFFHPTVGDFLLVAKRNLYLPTALVIITVIIVVASRFMRKDYMVYFALALIGIATFDVLRFDDKFQPFVTKSYVYPSTSVVTYLQQHSDNYRFTTDDNRIFAPNMNIMYTLQTLQGYDPLYLKNYALLLAADTGDISGSNHIPFDRIIDSQSISDRMLSFLGVKYVLSLSGSKQDQNLKRVFSDGHTYVYENTQVLPRAYFVRQVLQTNSVDGALRKISALHTDLRTMAVVLHAHVTSKYQVGNMAFVDYKPNNVAIQTQNAGKGFLVLTDAYYPTWHAFIDGKETHIYLTDYNYRGVIVPAGKHTVVFSDSLL